MKRGDEHEDDVRDASRFKHPIKSQKQKKRVLEILDKNYRLIL